MAYTGNTEEKKQQDKQQQEYIDLLVFARLLLRRKKLLAVGLLIGALAGWALSTFIIHPKYSSYVDLYVTNNKKAETGSVEYNDINAAQKLVSTYVVILQSNEVTQDVLTKLHSEMTSEELLDMTTFTSVNSTEVLRINVETKDPQMTQDICDAYMGVAQTALDSVVGAGSVKVISKPVLPDKPSYPSIPKFTAIGALLGLLAMVGLTLLSMGDNRPISDDKMLTERYQIPVLGTVPDFFLFHRELRISKQDIKKNQKLKAKNPNNEKIITSATILSDNTPFQIREAYNGIRSNILFTLANMKNGIILVTSPNANELKTTTSINLAICIAHIGAKVLLIDCDLRNPSIYRQFKMSNKKGLSRVLTGFDSFDSSVTRNIVPGVDFLSAGPSTPRPSELLGSSNMLDFLKRQALYYDFVILDTSPLNVVSDSLALSSVAAGMILVARGNKTILKDLDRSINSIKMANGKIMGFVITDMDSSSGGYGYGKYGKYGYGYGEGKKDKGKSDDLNYSSEISMNSSYLNAFRRRKKKILLSEITEDEREYMSDADMDADVGDNDRSYRRSNYNQPAAGRDIRNHTGMTGRNNDVVSERQAFESLEAMRSIFSDNDDDQMNSLSDPFYDGKPSAALNATDSLDSDMDFSDDFSGGIADNSAQNSANASGMKKHPDNTADDGGISKTVSKSRQDGLSGKTYSGKNSVSVSDREKNKKTAKGFIAVGVAAMAVCALILPFTLHKNSNKEDKTVPVYSDTESFTEYDTESITESNESPESTESTDAVSSASTTADNSTSETTSDKTTTTSSSKLKTLRPGTESDDVLKMQIRLAELGYLTQESCTGYYGDYTKKRLKDFQQNAGLKETGIADVNTLKRLYADDAPKN